MNAKSVAVIAVSAAVVAGSYAAICVWKDRAAIARSEAAKAASLEEAELAKARAQKDTAATQRAMAAAAADNARAKADEKAARLAAADQARSENEAQKLRTREAELANDTATKNAQARADERAAREAELRTKKAEQAAEEARAKTAAAEAEKAQAAARKSEADTYKIRTSLAEVEAMRLQYLAMMEELAAYKRDLDAREAALRPELTANDLVTLGDDEAPRTETPYLAENDKSLALSVRSLARAERLDAEATEARAAAHRAEIVSRMESLYEAAIKEDRIADADYYAKVLRSFYPDWEYGGKKTEGNGQ